MKLDGQRESENVDDVRESGGGRGPRLPLPGGRLGLGTVAIALVASYFLGINPMTVLNVLGGMQGDPNQASGEVQRPDTSATPAQDAGSRFVRQVLATTEDVWRGQFQAQGARYQEPRLTLFRGSTPTACGQGEAAMGPFYCPADQRVYIDLDFYDTLKNRLGAPGDFAQAYVIAHEVGHHVQNLVGTSAKLEEARRRVSQAEYNALSVRLELQADCYAGIWAHDTEQSKGLMESGDLEEAMNAASQIGDDALQRGAGREVVPESFTHGSSAQRMRWFKRGFESGDMGQCDTFNTRTL
ncbi:KPN_02809 family neutral zinc metallopeptidase [Aquabacterium sp. UBA2148]|uniref:KPN_02809 family neutral zinc metallopeptidase n=1 Tax=Aquabacterium sp. UBA2148 TaxID=1946042 RepID=UPI002580CA4C|nr:neutral zinc metallopeptidase [Aquabacterium sp. UBA2148]